MRKAFISAALASTTLAKGWEHELDGDYDATDPDTIAAVQAAVDAAVEAERERHEADVEGLKAKNKDLTERLRKARAGEGNDTSEIDRLERELEEVRGELNTAQKDLRETKRQLTAAENARAKAEQTVETETAFSRNMLVESALTSSLTENKVAPQFFEAAKALLGKGVTVKEVDGERKPFVGDKPLGEFVKEWATGEAGKAFILAPASGGGGVNGGNASGGGTGGKKLAEMTEQERTEMARSNPAAFQQLLAAEGPTNLAA